MIFQFGFEVLLCAFCFVVFPRFIENCRVERNRRDAMAELNLPLIAAAAAAPAPLTGVDAAPPLMPTVGTALSVHDIVSDMDLAPT